MPRTTASGTASARIPAHLRSSISRSLGHLRTASTSPSRRTVSTSATPASSGSHPYHRGVVRGRSRTLTASPARGGEVHWRSSRPRPALWRSATTTSPSAAPARAAAATSALVDPVSVVTTTSLHSPPGTTSARRRAVADSGGRSRSRYGEGRIRSAYALTLVTIGGVTTTHRHGTREKIEDLRRRTDEAVHAGSARAVEKQHARGKKTARERIELLLDPGTFVELDELARHRSTAFGLDSTRPYGDGVVTGDGTGGGPQVCVFAQDFTVFGGSLGEVFGEKIVKVMDLAMKVGCPVIGINDSGGARIQEGVVSLGLYGEIFMRNVRASGVIPQISLVMGPCAGGAVYSPALTDFTVMVDQTSHMFITGPDVIKTVTGEDVGFEELGGGRTHNAVSGNAHYLGADEEDAIGYVKALLSYLPSNNLDDPPLLDSPPVVEHDLDTLIPDSANQPYDMHRVIEAVVEDFLEVQPLYAQNILVRFTRVDGRPVCRV